MRCPCAAGRPACSALPGVAPNAATGGSRGRHFQQLQVQDHAHGGRQDLHLLLAAGRPKSTGFAGIARLPNSLKVVLENLLRFEDGRTVTADDIKAVAASGSRTRQGRARNRLPPGPRADAGFHRRSRRGRSRGDARRDGKARRRSAEDQPAGAGRSRHRPFGDGRLFRHRRPLSSRTSSSNTSATASATNSCAGARRRSTISASCRPAPASATR